MKSFNFSHALILTLALIVLNALPGCDILSSPDKETALPKTEFDYTDEHLLAIAYSSYKFPDDFYQEELNGGSIYYVNTVSVLPLSEREPIWIEFCTEFRDQAFDWTESSNVNSAYYRELVSESEAEKYYEFRRVYAARPNDIVLFRVHKCSYLDRSAVDNFLHSDTLGVFGQRPVTKAAVKELAEYIHFINTYNIGNYKVLSSKVEESESSVNHVILQLTLLTGDWGMCDYIELGTIAYSVDKESGIITKSRENIRGIRGKCR